MTDDARRTAERAARTSYGRLLALIARDTGDLLIAEDALSEAFAAALTTWPERGIPDNPEAWLLTAARRTAGHGRRHQSVRDRAAESIMSLHEERAAESDQFPDRRLELMLACAHPAIDPSVRTPLMLQAVLGLDARTIAAAFLVRPETMGQRLVRAKAKIRDAGIPFECPGADELKPRLTDVLNAIYAAFGTGWDALAGVENDVRGLAGEAIFLGRLVVSLVPDDAEAKGLLALMLYCEARTAARRGPDGQFVPLRDQDQRLWSRDMIVEAERLLTEAASTKALGRYQCEAAIQSFHVSRPPDGSPAWAALTALYDLLVAQAPSLGVLIARAAALSDAGDPARALAELDALPPERIARYQPYWVTRARVLSLLGRRATVEQGRAIGLTEDPAIEAYLRREFATSASAET